jgi:pseudouridine-5'-phosphate glycosidase
MTLNPYLDIAPEVQHALQNGIPVVALESTIISHGMPYPQNVQTALMVEAEVRAHGARDHRHRERALEGRPVGS